MDEKCLKFSLKRFFHMTDKLTILFDIAKIS